MPISYSTYLSDILRQVISSKSKVKVSSNYHEQMKQIKHLLKNDTSGIVCTILDFMIQSACVPINFESKNETLNKIFQDWQINLNSDINMDIPRGFRSFTEQYFRERWESSFIVLNIQWGVIDGYEMPLYMWFSDGANIYSERKDTDLKSTKYYVGKPNLNNNFPLISTTTKTILVRKPYNHWYDKYPTPYLVKKGALYHALFQEKIIDKQSEIIAQVFPAMLMIKAGHDNNVPTEPDLTALKQKVQDLNSETDDRTSNNGLIGAFPYDVSIDHLIPDFKKILDETILAGTDRKLLMALGLIEFKGFSTNREEAVLNPKPLVSEIEDAVKDFVELIDDIVYEIQKRNSKARKFSAKDVKIGHGPIKAILTDSMKQLIRSLYDRGVVAKSTVVEGTTDYNFDLEVEKRKKETEDGLDDVMFAPVIMNQDNKERPDVKGDPNSEQVPEKKKSEKNTAKINEVTNDYTEEEKSLFIDAYDECMIACEELDYDEDLAEKFSIEWATKKVKEQKEYVEAPYDTNKELPDSVKVLPKRAQTIFRNVVNDALKSGDTEEVAFKKAWSVVKNAGYYKDTDGKWKKRKS